MSCKKKFRIARIITCFTIPIFISVVVALYVAFGAYEIVEAIPENGITTPDQWFIIISFRLIIYLVPASLISFWKFDKRYKYSSRFLIWLNFILCILTIANVSYKFFGLDMVFKKDIFSSLDSFAVLGGYLLTFIFKKKIEFDSTGAIIEHEKIN